MKKPNFSRSKLIAAMLSHERVRIRSFDDNDDGRCHGLDDRYDMRFVVGAYANIDVRFFQSPALPEWARAYVGGKSFIFTAGECSEEEMAEALWEHAKSLAYARVSWEKHSQRKTEVVLTEVHSSPLEPLCLRDDAEPEDGGPALFGDKAKAVRTVLKIRAGQAPGGETLYEDIVFGKPESPSEMGVRAVGRAVAKVWEEVSPNCPIVGCDENEIWFSFCGGHGTVYIDEDIYGSGSCVEVDVGLSLAGEWSGEATMEVIEFPFDAGEEAVHDALRERADAFKASCRSLLDNPLVIDEVLLESNYRQSSVPYAMRTLYPASTPEEIWRAVGNRFIERPVELARKILAGDDLDGYVQRSYDEQHDYEVIVHDISYDEDTETLTWLQDENECCHIDRIPSCTETSSYSVARLSRQRLERLAQLEDKVRKYDPHDVEWTLWIEKTSDGAVAIEVGEFPSLRCEAATNIEAHQGIYEQISAEINRLMAAGEVPHPFSWQEAEAYREQKRSQGESEEV